MSKISRFLLSLCLLGVASRARAALDDAVDTGGLRGVMVAGLALGVRSHDGIDEYVDGGRVIAIKWHRRLAPPLLALLGAYRATYEQAMRDRHRVGHGLVTLRTPTLAVQMQARPRAHRGAIWLVARMPKGVTIDALP